MIQTGSGNLQGNRREGNGFGLNLSTLIDLASIGMDVGTGNIPGAAMGAATFLDDASGNQVLGEDLNQAVDAAQMVMGLGGAAKGLAKGGAKAGAKALTEGSKNFKNVSKAAKAAGDLMPEATKMTADVAKGTSAAKELLKQKDALGALAKGKDITDLKGIMNDVGRAQGGMLSGLGKELEMAGGIGMGDDLNSVMGMVEGLRDPAQMQAILSDPATIQTINEVAGQFGKQAPSFMDIMNKIQNFADPALEYAQMGTELADLYNQVTAGPGAPGMAPNRGGGGYGGNTVASQFQRGY